MLIDRVWGANYFGDTKTLDVHIKRLRAKVEDEGIVVIVVLTIGAIAFSFASAPPLVKNTFWWVSGNSSVIACAASPREATATDDPAVAFQHLIRPFLCLLR